MQHDIFISYSTQDRLIAETIVKALREQGISCWIAPDDIPPGSSWPEAIVEAIDGCRLMLAVLSDKSIKSSQVINELNLAAQAGRTIVPLRIENVQPPKPMRYALASYQWVDVFPNVSAHLDKLAQDLRLLLTKLESTVPEVKLVAPSAGNAWPAGSQQSIRWEAVMAGGRTVSDVRIDLRRGGREVLRIADTASGLVTTTDQYAWQVPSDLEPATDYQVQLSVVDDADRTGCVQATFAIAAGSPAAEFRPAAHETPKAAQPEAVTTSSAATVQHTIGPAPTTIPNRTITPDEESSNSLALLFYMMSMVILFPALICAAGGMAYEVKEVVFGLPTSGPVGLQYAIPAPSSPPQGPIGLIVYALEKIFNNFGATWAGLGRGLLRGGLFGVIIGSLMAIVAAITGMIVSAVRRRPWQVVFEELGDPALAFAVAASSIAAFAIFLGGYDWQYGGLGVGLVAAAFYAVVIHRELNQQRQKRLLGKV